MTFRDFEGQPVTESGFEMPAAGGGLHASLGIDGLELQPGDQRTLVLQVECTKLRFDPIDKDDLEGDLRRVHVLRVLGAAQLDTDEARNALKQQAERVAAEKARRDAEAAAERGELPLGSPEAAGETDLCAHDQPREDCELCGNQGDLPYDDDGPAADVSPDTDDDSRHLRAVGDDE